MLTASQDAPALLQYSNQLYTRALQAMQSMMLASSSTYILQC